jgi:hypothetical protein
MCRCRRSVPDLPAKPKIVFGEEGLDLMACVAEDPYPVVGDFTGYRYPFNVRPKMYIDRRDTVYLLNNDFSLVN